MKKGLTASESEEQQALFEWAALKSGNFSELSLMFHIPNEGKRSKSYGGRLKAEGLKAGVPDIFLPVARGNYHGLFIEMKSNKGKVLESQLCWLEQLRTQGFKTVVCYGWVEAAAVIEKYLQGVI